ncbi:hypothetical protein BDA96_10G266100 [Sorghum bicolor]|uniref:Uncharacterized protein n=1 Tax=Sorghum bicolor TaxID=4558 RepID=A0A921Q5J6_SORBI|nr:hypothetical protein BDA96_10G266100 [Sorghum bicolor]
MLMPLSRNYSVSCGLLLMFGRFVNTVICLKACVGIAMWVCGLDGNFAVILYYKNA